MASFKVLRHRDLENLKHTYTNETIKKQKRRENQTRDAHWHWQRLEMAGTPLFLALSTHLEKPCKTMLKKTSMIYTPSKLSKVSETIHRNLVSRTFEYREENESESHSNH